MQNDDLPRVLVRQQHPLGVVLQGLFNLGMLRDTDSKHYPSNNRKSFVGKLQCLHARRCHHRVLVEREFDLQRIYPLPRDFDQIISTTLKKIKPLLIADESISCVDPSVAHGLCSVFRPIPVMCCAGQAPNGHNTFLTLQSFKPV